MLAFGWHKCWMSTANGELRTVFSFHTYVWIYSFLWIHFPNIICIRPLITIRSFVQYWIPCSTQFWIQVHRAHSFWCKYYNIIVWMHLWGKLIEYSISRWKVSSIFVGGNKSFLYESRKFLWIIRLLVIVNDWTIIILYNRSSKSAIPVQLQFNEKCNLFGGPLKTPKSKSNKKKWKKSKKNPFFRIQRYSIFSHCTFRASTVSQNSFVRSNKMSLQLMAMWSCIGISLNCWLSECRYHNWENKMGIDDCAEHR